MWRVILLVFCYHVVSQSQPVSDEPSTRHTRELIECCPCPGSTQRGPDMLGWSRGADDCPCRAQSDDSEGASSLLFPTRTTPKSFNSVPFMRSNDPKDEIKNLLEPEVGLATSMLQTLREATEEEYRDALARDAARSSDTVPEESADVVIIVKPRASDDEDIFVSEASNVKDTRCIQPLGRMRNSKPFKTLPEFFRLPKARQPGLHNLWDMDSNVGASTVQENFANIDGGIEKPRTPSFKFRTPLKEIKLKSSNNDDNNKVPTLFEKLEQSLRNRPNLFERFPLPLDPKLNVDNPVIKPVTKIDTDDLALSPSNAHELIEKEDKENGIFKLNKRPLMLKNLLKLKDVELIPKTIPKIPIFKSKLNNKESLDRDANDKCEDSTYDSAMNEKVLMPKTVKTDNFEAQNDQNNPQKLAESTIKLEEDSQDSFTSPSEVIETVIDGKQTNAVDSDEIDCSNLSIEEIITSTAKPISQIFKENEGKLDETLNPNLLSEIEDITEIEKDDMTQSCETEKVSETINDVNDHSDSGSSNNDIEKITPFTSQENGGLILEPQLREANFSENFEEDSNIQSVEDKFNNIEPTSLIMKKNFTSKPIPPLSETLSTIRENVRKSLENLKKAPFQISSTKLQEDNDNTETPKIENLTKDPRSDELAEEMVSESNDIATTDQALFTNKQSLTDDLLVSSSNKQQNFTPKESETGDDSKESQTTATLDQVTFNDLQKLSDDLLVLSSNKEQNLATEESETEDELNDADFTLTGEQKQIDEAEPEMLKDENSSMPSTESTTTESSTLTKEKACRVGIDKNKTKPKIAQQFKSMSQDENAGDMSVEASAPSANILPKLLDPLSLNEQLRPLFQNTDPLVPLNLNEKLAVPLLPNLDPLNLNKNLGSSLIANLDPLNLNEKLRSPVFPDLDPLNLNEKLAAPLLPNLDPLNVRSSLQDIITQPTISDSSLNLLGKPITEVLKLPTLDDLRERLSSVFNTNERSAENNFSDEDGECSNIAPEMTSAASTNSFLKIPTIRPLEDLNVDVFQLNPLSSSQPDFMTKVPRLNLNNFRTKLQTPSNLDLKPVKLESRIGNNKGNILGASLTFGPDKATSRKYKPQTNLLGHPLSSLPSLDELRKTLHSGTPNLLGSPLKPNLELFRDSPLRSSGIPDLDEIRRNAEKTMKGLQQRMKSTFKGGKLSNPLSDKFARPQDLLEDVNDKLKAIHYDLNDRLSSIHEDFLDQTRLKPLEIPARIPSFAPRNSNRNAMSTIRKTKGKPARLQTSASTISSHEIDQFENTDRNWMQSQTRSSLRKIPTNQPRTLDSAESSPVPTKVEFPKPRTQLQLLSQRLPSLRQGSENIFPEINRGKPLTLPKYTGFAKDLKSPILRKPSPFKEKTNKVTITFATTTPNPVITPLEKYRTTPTVKPSKSGISNSESLKERISLPRTKTFGDGKQSATEVRPLGMSSPVKSKNNFKTANSEIKNLPQNQNLDYIEDKPKVTFKSIKDSKIRLNDNNTDRQNAAWELNNKRNKNVEVAEKLKAKPLVWPKTNEESFLAKVKDAMQARLASFGSTKTPEKVDVAKVDKVESRTDMLRSASENSDVIVEAPLKESVPYKCRMVCTRDN